MTDTPPNNEKVQGRVAVAMTTFNGGRFLRQQLDSILQQTLPPASIIICDDGSTDNTISILDEYAGKFPVIHYEVNSERLGVIENFKKAVSRASAPYIALSDQDDIWKPAKLETLLKKLIAIENSDLPALVFSDLEVIDAENKPLNPSFWNELGQDGYQHCYDTVLFGNFITGCTVLMNGHMKPFFASMPKDVLMHDAWLSLVAYSFGKAAETSETLVRYRRHDSNAAFLASYRKKGLVERILNHFRSVFGNRDYLEEQLQLVQQFFDLYHDKLTTTQARRTRKFLRLKNKPYLQKIVTFWIWFRPYRH